MINNHCYILGDDFEGNRSIAFHLCLSSLKLNRAVCIVDIGGDNRDLLPSLEKRTSRKCSTLDSESVFILKDSDVSLSAKDVAEVVYIPLATDDDLSLLPILPAKIFSNALIVVFISDEKIKKDLSAFSFLENVLPKSSKVQFYIFEDSENKRCPLEKHENIDIVHLREYSALETFL